MAGGGVGALEGEFEAAVGVGGRLGTGWLEAVFFGRRGDEGVVGGDLEVVREGGNGQGEAGAALVWVFGFSVRGAFGGWA